ncbi:CoA transferase, partial [Chloroflexota bacterium]
MDRLIGEWTASHEAQEVMDGMQKAGVPASIVAKGRDLYESPQLKSRDYYTEQEYYLPDFTKPGIEWKAAPHKTLAARVPISMSKTQPGIGRYGRVGEDNEYIYKEVLGLSDGELNTLVESGVIR